MTLINKYISKFVETKNKKQTVEEIKKIIILYTKTGWENITKGLNDYNYQKQIINKLNENNTNNLSETQLTNKYKDNLKLYGDFREFLVNTVFKEIKNKQKNLTKNHSMIATGSKNISSDYDVTLLGENTNYIMNEMKKRIEQIFKECDCPYDKKDNCYPCQLPWIFDTNLYNGSASFNSVPPKVFSYLQVEKDYIIYKESNNFFNKQLIWGFLKLVKGFKLFKKANVQTKLNYKENFKLFFLEGKALYKKLNQYFCDANQIGENKQFSNQYKSLIKYSKKLDNYVYKNKGNTSVNHIEDYTYSVSGLMSFTKWLSLEAYYSLYTIIHVVLEMQRKIDLNKMKYYVEKKETKIDIINFKRNMYLISSIENFGDFMIHTYSKKIDYISFVKNSKYLNRIYNAFYNYSLISIDKIPKNKKKIIEIKHNQYQKVVEYRKDPIKYKKNILKIFNAKINKNFIFKEFLFIYNFLNNIAEHNDKCKLFKHFIIINNNLSKKTQKNKLIRNTKELCDNKIKKLNKKTKKKTKKPNKKVNKLNKKTTIKLNRKIKNTKNKKTKKTKKFYNSKTKTFYNK